jgi:uroporphyrinogen-III synthase
MMRVLVTRPEPDGEKTAKALRKLGFDPVVIRLSTIVPLDPGVLPPSDAVIATSAHALRCLPGAWRNARLFERPIHVVGARTAEAAREAGFLTVIEGPGDAAGLVTHMIGRPARPSLLYLAGEPRKPIVETALEDAGFALKTAILYKNEPMDAMPATLQHLLETGEPLAVLHFSRASAEAFLRLAGSAIAAPLLHLCLSADIASVLSGEIILAEQPNEAALLRALQLHAA